MDPRHPPEKVHRGAELAFHLPGDFNCNATSKYGFLAEKSIPTPSTPVPTEFVCIQERSGFAVFHDLLTGQGVVAKIPSSWGPARSTRTAAPPPDGGRVERPASLLPPFNSADEALKAFQRLSSPSRS
jgi:hypothetical protein